MGSMVRTQAESGGSAVNGWSAGAQGVGTPTPDEMDRSAPSWNDAPRVPASHADLLERPLNIVMSTEMPDGRFQSTVVWFSHDGDDLLVNTLREFQQARNLRARPRATLLLMEPPDGERWIEIRGTVEIEEMGARAHLDDLARAYAGVDHYFGHVVPADLADVEHPLICRVHPVAVSTGPRTLPAPAARRSAPVPLAAVRPCTEEITLPTSHRDLLDRPLLAALTTRLRTGAQTNPVWFARDDNDVLIDTTLERSKGRNLVTDPRATVLIVDPDDAGRWIEIRGDVDLSETDALGLLDRLTRRYTPSPAYYGYVYPTPYRGPETPVIARIHPRRINCDAIH
jgi:PPOX class probable F420-dependent enzyme